MLGLLLAAQTEATQVIENSHAQHVQVNISASETNRLAVEGRRITNVVPAQPGLISAKKDEAQGALYFTLATNQSVVGTVTLFVSDDHNVTYKLILVPRPIAGEEIILRPPTEKVSSTTAKDRRADGRAASYQRRIKDMILMMADDELQDAAVDKVDVNAEIPLWKEGYLTLAARYHQADLVGEKYLLKNVSRRDMLLVEQELFRRGVRAVSVQHQTLTPGDSTAIYIVRKSKDSE